MVKKATSKIKKVSEAKFREHEKAVAIFRKKKAEKTKKKGK